MRRFLLVLAGLVLVGCGGEQATAAPAPALEQVSQAVLTGASWASLGPSPQGRVFSLSSGVFMVEESSPVQFHLWKGDSWAAFPTPGGNDPISTGAALSLTVLGDAPVFTSSAGYTYAFDVAGNKWSKKYLDQRDVRVATEWPEQKLAPRAQDCPSGWLRPTQNNRSCLVR